MLAALRVAVGLARRVEVAAGTGAIGRAAIPLFVNMETVQARRKTADFGKHLQLLTRLDERDRAADLVALRRRHLRLGTIGPARCTHAPHATGKQPAASHRANQNELLPF